MMALENEKQLHIFSTIVRYVIFKINNVSFLIYQQIVLKSIMIMRNSKTTS